MPTGLSFDGSKFSALTVVGLVFPVPASQVSSGLVVVQGDFVYLEDGTNTYKKAVTTGAALINFVGVVSIGNASASQGFTIIRKPALSVPLGIFGTLAQLNALGNTHEGYVNAGRLAVIDGASGHFNCKAITLPKTFASLVEADRSNLLVTLGDYPVIAN